LTEAKTNLNRGDYRAAREGAEQSREKAVAARRLAESATAAAKPQS
jgi:HEPN domain-containing protein